MTISTTVPIGGKDVNYLQAMNMAGLNGSLGVTRGELEAMKTDIGVLESSQAGDVLDLAQTFLDNFDSLSGGDGHISNDEIHTLYLQQNPIEEIVFTDGKYVAPQDPFFSNAFIDNINRPSPSQDKTFSEEGPLFMESSGPVQDNIIELVPIETTAKATATETNPVIGDPIVTSPPEPLPVENTIPPGAEDGPPL